MNKSTFSIKIETILELVNILPHSPEADSVTWILIIKANKMHNFSNLFDKVFLHVSDRSTAHHQEYLNSVYGCLLA
jgi:hypothetical protein